MTLLVLVPRMVPESGLAGFTVPLISSSPLGHEPTLFCQHVLDCCNRQVTKLPLSLKQRWGYPMVIDGFSNNL